MPPRQSSSAIVALNTSRGVVELEVAPASARCITAGCRVIGGGLAAVTVRQVGKPDARFIVCGNCLARALGRVVGGE